MPRRHVQDFRLAFGGGKDACLDKNRHYSPNAIRRPRFHGGTVGIKRALRGDHHLFLRRFRPHKLFPPRRLVQIHHVHEDVIAVFQPLENDKIYVAAATYDLKQESDSCPSAPLLSLHIFYREHSSASQSSNHVLSSSSNCLVTCQHLQRQSEAGK